MSLRPKDETRSLLEDVTLEEIDQYQLLDRREHKKTRGSMFRDMSMNHSKPSEAF